MKTKMTKITAMLLVLVLCIASFSGCGEKKPANTDATAEPSTTGSSEGDNTQAEGKEKEKLTDLGGLKITIGDWYTPEKEDLSTAYAEDTDAYRKDIEKTYNFTIARKNVAAWQDMGKKFSNEVMGNGATCDLYYLYQEQLSSPLLNGLCYDLSTVSTIDLTEEKWNPMVNEVAKVGDSVYGMNPEKEPRAGVFFNKRLFKEAGVDPELPYDLQKSGEWTWAKFEEICKTLTRDTDNDGKPNVYALASFSKDFFKMCAATNNANFIGKKDGFYTNETGTQQFLDAMNWGVSLIQKGYIMPQPEGSNWDWFTAAFRDGEIAMQVAEEYQVSSFKNMDDEYGFVLFPKGTAEGAEMKTVPMDNVIVMPSYFDQDKAKKVLFAYDLYTEQTPGYEDSESWKEALKANFKDTRAVDETLVMMRDAKYQTVSYLPLVASTDYGQLTYGIEAREKTPTEIIQEVSPQWDSYIQEANNKITAFQNGKK